MHVKLPAVLAAAMASVGCSPPQCANGTVFLSLHYGRGVEQADAIDVGLSIDGGAVQHQHATRTPGKTDDSISLAFASGYPHGETLVITVEALQATQPVGAAMTTVTASSHCIAPHVDVEPVNGDGGTTGSAPAFVTKSSGYVKNAQPLALPAWSGVQAGDLLYLATFVLPQSAALPAPSGWTLVTSATPPSANYGVAWYERTAGAAESAPTLTSSGASELGAIAVAYRGSTTPVLAEQSGLPTDTPGTQTGATITFGGEAPAAASASERAVLTVAYESGDAESFMASSGLMLRADVGVLAVYDAPASTAMTALDATATWSSGNSNDGSTFIVNLR